MRIIAIVLVAVATVACESADRRAFNERIDEHEAAAAAEQEIYETFENALIRELRDEYGAIAGAGCPDMTPLPGVGLNDPYVPLLPSAEDRERFRQVREREIQARTDAWEDNAPGERCQCLQATIENVRSEIEALERTNFEAERNEVAETSDEALAQRMAFGGLPASDRFAPERAQRRVARWETRRHEDWRGNVDRWSENEERHGWEQYRYVARDPGPGTLRETSEPVLVNMRWNFERLGCGEF